MRESGLTSLHLDVGGELAEFNKKFEKQIKASKALIDDDVVRKSIARFWNEQKLDSLRDAQLVSHGLTLKVDSTKPSLMEDRQRFRAVLDTQAGVGQWLENPRWFRRCYRGLVGSYFSYDGRDSKKPVDGQKNWIDLRDYLFKHSERIIDAEFSMDWVEVATQNRSLFSDKPCAQCASAAFEGRTEVIDLITNELGIDRDSWFHWELIMAQVRHATSLVDDRFVDQIPRLLSLITGNVFVREKAMAQILDRYAESRQTVVHPALRDTAVAWWGNPWLPSDEQRWGGVQQHTREMVAVWLRKDFIEAFFAKLARDGVGDKTRANFWLRYVKSMKQVEFGLGSLALNSRDRDFVLLREKMKGLFQRLDDPNPSNNAFIMTFGSLVAVEFGGESNALYGYDQRRQLPFDMSRPLQVPVDARNSLKHREPVRVLWLQHQDNIRGYAQWEDMFAAELRNKFGIVPDDQQQASGVGRSTVVRGTETRGSDDPPIPPFSEATLDNFARKHGFRIRDNRARNGNLRAETHNLIPEVSRVLRAWGFEYNHGGFWWKK